ncbi:MAG TPA: DUF4386 domain-containing protein [Bacillota bacterium]|nr:DUF4386 domain-containing protein [Bacillota bacterium]
MKLKEIKKVTNLQKSARIVGILFILGTVSGLLSLNMVSILNAPDYMVKFSENKTSVVFGVLSVLTMGISLSMMSVVLYPVIKKYNEALALGAVIFRGALELASYLGIAASWLMLLLLSKRYVLEGSPVASEYLLMGDTLKDLAFVSGSMGLGAIVFSIGAIIIYYVFLKTRLLPVWLSVWGLIGAVLYISTPILMMFGLNLEFLQYILGVQEMVMAVWLIVKGFNKSVVSAMMINTD